jgi:hypothetical protein
MSEVRESYSIYWAPVPRKEPIFLAIILFRLCDGEKFEDDDEHENEDDFSTSEFRAKKGESGGNPG